MIKTCTLVLEYNHQKSGQPDLGSVWLFSGDASADLQRDKQFGTLAGWIRVVGPIEYEAAAEAYESLKKFFRENGVAVIAEGTAD